MLRRLLDRKVNCKVLGCQRRPESTTSSQTKEKNVLPKTDSASLPPPWENPWLYALGPPQPPPKYTQVESSTEEFKWVERLKPTVIIPDVPKHEKYPTPSGWRPPKNPPPALPYFVARNRKHVFNISLERRRDTLDTVTVEFNYVELVVLRNVHGDVFACEKDLKQYLTQKVGHTIATHVNEPQGKIRVKGADRSLVEQFLWDCGF
uniref:Large ribosomal subunit protein mL49 n=1 Tax=Romanomermis culicivorax TaxID=13658 RepID=A0A915JTI4_ROMCU